MTRFAAALALGFAVAGPVLAAEPLPIRNGPVLIQPAVLRAGEVRTYNIDTRAGAVATPAQVSTRTVRIAVADGPAGPFLRVAVQDYTAGSAYAATVEEVAAQAMVGLTADVEANAAGRPTTITNWDDLRPRIAANLAGLSASAARDQLAAWLRDGDASAAAAGFLGDALAIGDMQSLGPLPAGGRQDDPPSQLRGVRRTSYLEATGLERATCSIVLHRYSGTDPAIPEAQRTFVAYLDSVAEVSMTDGWVVRMQVVQHQLADGRATSRTRLIARTSNIPGCADNPGAPGP